MSVYWIFLRCTVAPLRSRCQNRLWRSNQFLQRLFKNLKDTLWQPRGLTFTMRPLCVHMTSPSVASGQHWRMCNTFEAAQNQCKDREGIKQQRLTKEFYTRLENIQGNKKKYIVYIKFELCRPWCFLYLFSVTTCLFFLSNLPLSSLHCCSKQTDGYIVISLKCGSAYSGHLTHFLQRSSTATLLTSD